MMNLIKKHLSDLAAGKWGEYKAALATNVVYDEVPTRLVARNADDYVKAIQRWKTAFPDLRADNVKLFAADDNVIAELEWMGTHEGTFEGPYGAIAPTHKKGSVKAALVFKIKNDKIIEVRHYFDLMTVLAQLGIAPAIGPVAVQPKVGAPPPVRH